MEKLGVVTDPEKTKTADKGERCPKCGKLAHYDTNRNVPWCMECGTEPWEKKPEK
jgi:uncharacterized protein (DUF983 family)